MKMNSFEECLEGYGNFWDERDNIKRQEVMKDFYYSIVVQGAVEEEDVAREWCVKNVGTEEILWKKLWYGKIDYDYGFWEFFFKKLEDADKFKKNVPILYVEVNGKKWRTSGSGNFIDIS